MLPAAASTVDYLARLLAGERARRGTCRGRRALEVSAQAVVLLCWFLDNAQVRQLARDNAISRATDRYLHEGIDVLAAAVHGLHGALLAARAATDSSPTDEHLLHRFAVSRVSLCRGPGPRRNTSCALPDVDSGGSRRLPLTCSVGQVKLDAFDVP